MASTARDLGLALLAESSEYDAPVALDGERDAAVLGLVLRGRRFVRAAFCLADAGLGIEAMLLVRSATEYAITVGWLLKNPEDNVLRFLISGIDDRLEWDSVAADADARHRFSEAQRGAMSKARAVLVERSSGHRMPKVKQQAKEADLERSYASYAADSQVAAHPTMWALDMFLDVLELTRFH